jgi:CRISPR/Cas system-associated endonuclease Cas1
MSAKNRALGWGRADVAASPARVRKRGEMLVIQTEEAGETTARLIDTSHLVLIGAVDVTAPVLHEPFLWSNAAR